MNRQELVEGLIEIGKKQAKLFNLNLDLKEFAGNESIYEWYSDKDDSVITLTNAKEWIDFEYFIVEGKYSEKVGYQGGFFFHEVAGMEEETFDLTSCDKVSYGEKASEAREEELLSSFEKQIVKFLEEN